MAWPIANPANLGYVVNFAARVGAHVAGAMGETLLMPFTREMHYVANNASSNVVPSFDVASKVYYAGMITHEEYYRVCGWNGIYMGLEVPDELLSSSRKTWKKWIVANHPRADVGLYATLYQQGYVDWDVLEARLKLDGITLPRDKELMRLRPNVGTIPEWVTFWQQGLTGDIGLVEAIHRNGIWDASYIAAIKAQRSPVGTEQARARYTAGLWGEAELLAELSRSGYGQAGDRERVMGFTAPHSAATAQILHWRQRITDDELSDYLVYNGLSTQQLQDEFRVAATPVPGPADLVRFAVREAWDIGVVDRWGYDAEFPRELDAWLRVQGLGDPQPVIAEDGQVIDTEAWSKMYWRSHWQPMSPTQAIESYRRFSAQTLPRYQEFFPGLTEFTIQHLDDVLKIADYPPAVRGWLAALSIPRMDKRDLHRLYMLGVRDVQFVGLHLIEHGYVQTDVDAILALWAKDKLIAESKVQRHIEDATARAIVGKIVEGYSIGWISRAEATARLNAHALSADTVSDMLDVADQEQYVTYLKEYVRAVKKEFLDGSLSLAEAGLRLQGAQITQERVALTLQRWGQLMTTRRKALTSAQIIALAKQGILTPAAASVRLTNLGWVQGDIALQLLSVQRSLSLAQNKALQAQGKARVQARKQLAQAARQAVALRKQALSQLRALYPKAELKRWLKEGIVTVPYVIERLREQQRNDEYIAKFIADAEYVKPPKPPKPKAAPAPTPGAPGTPPAGPVG